MSFKCALLKAVCWFPMVSERPGSPITIARYRKVRAWFSFMVGILVAMAPPYITFWAYGGHAISDSINSRRIDLIFFLATMWILAPVVLFATVSLFKQLVFDSGRALWIENQRLIFWHPWLFSVPCDEIVSVSYGKAQTSTFVKQKGIALNLRNGGQKVFITGGLSEPRDVIIARLNAALNLRSDPSLEKESATSSMPRLDRS